MHLLTNLALLAATDEQIDLVKYITIGVLVLIAVAVVIISTVNRKGKAFDTRTLIYAAICIATSFALSYLKFSMPYGGSITFASLVPLMIFAYVYGPVRGLLAGFVYGLLQFIQDPWFLTGTQFLLDYLLAFGTIAVVGAFKGAVKSRKASVFLGVAAFGVLRLIMHTCSGIIFVNANYITEVAWMANLVNTGAIVYSLVYNGLFVLPDTVICAGVFVYLLYSGSFNRLLTLIAPRQTGRGPVTEEAQSGTETEAAAAETVPERKE